MSVQKMEQALDAALAGKDRDVLSSSYSSHSRFFLMRGRLPKYLYDRLTQAIETDSLGMVLCHHQTPTAWQENGEWVLPEYPYSPSTLRFQKYVAERLRNSVGYIHLPTRILPSLSDSQFSLYLRMDDHERGVSRETLKDWGYRPTTIDSMIRAGFLFENNGKILPVPRLPQRIEPDLIAA